MLENLHLVFSQPPEMVTDGDFNAWYDAHLGEILAVPGFVAARRYRLRPITEYSDGPPSGPAQYSYLSAYQIDGDLEDAVAGLAAEDRPQLVERPAWRDGVRFASVNCFSHGNPTDTSLVDHFYLVFSAAPTGMADEAYVEWYREHAAENARTPGFVGNWRFRVVPEVVDPAGPITSTHLSAYEVTEELPVLHKALADAKDAGVIGFPSWFDEIPFASVEAQAIGPVVTADPSAG